ncbi:MAG: hypothetical protein M1823_008124, partial [Watsoniomyces obsoletus]
MHEYRFTEHSLYAALSVGLRGEDIIRALEKLSKTPVPESVIEFIDRHTKSYGKVRLVLRQNQFFVESDDPDLIMMLQRDPVIGECATGNVESGIRRNKAAVIQGTNEAKAVQQAQSRSDPATEQAALINSLRDEDDEDDQAIEHTNYFSIASNKRDI